MQDTLILDIGPEFERFRDRVKPLVENFKAYAEAAIEDILKYIHGASDGADLLQEFIDKLEETALAEGMDDQDVDTVKEATLELGQKIFKHLQEIGAYDSHGVLAFKFKEILGHDIVLEPYAPEDFALDETDSTDEEDVATLYENLAPRNGGEDDDEMPDYDRD